MAAYLLSGERRVDSDTGTSEADNLSQNASGMEGSRYHRFLVDGNSTLTTQFRRWAERRTT